MDWLPEAVRMVGSDPVGGLSLADPGEEELPAGMDCAGMDCAGMDCAGMDCAGMDWAGLEAQWAEEDAADERLAAATEPDGPELIKAGFWDRGRGDGCGFAAGGAADELPPGAVLAELADRAWARGLPRLSDDELIGVLRAARRLASRAAALEFAAADDLMRRRLAQEDAGEAGVAEHAVDELAAALTLTGRAADRLLSVAMTLSTLPATSAALAAGAIDPPKAAVVADETAALGPAHRAAVEDHVLARAPRQTTGQLRSATRRAVIAADPAAARKRKEKAQQEARVERWEEDAGTAALAGRDLPPAGVLAADQNLSGLARSLKAAGAPGTMDHLRARVYLALLAGQPISFPSQRPGTDQRDADATPEGWAGVGNTGSGDRARGTGLVGGGADAGSRPPAGTSALKGVTSSPATPAHEGAATLPAIPARGSATAPGFSASGDQPALRGGVNLTLPLATWLGAGDAPGNVAGTGTLDADDSRAVAAALAARAGRTWCITVTDTHGRPVAHGCAGPRPRRSRSGPRSGPERAGPPRGGPAWNFTITPLAGEHCAHARETAAYEPTAGLRHVLEVRHATCTFPGCRRSAARCDQDHTIPYDQGGRTCECDLAPLCRRHHRAKQTSGWRLEQPRPGVLVWTTPSGRTYTTHPTQYQE